MAKVEPMTREEIERRKKELQNGRNPIATVIPEKVEEKIPDFLPQVTVSRLPSNFKMYDLKEDSIKYNSYLYGELMEFNQSSMPHMETIDYIMRGIHTPFSKGQLYYSVYLLIAIQRRLLTFKSNDFTIKDIYCQECGNPLVLQSSLDQIDFKELEVELPIIFTADTGDVFHFKPLTVDAYKFLYTTKKLDDVLSIMAAEVCNMPFEEAYKKLFNLNTPDDIDALEYIDKVIDFGVKPMKIVCKNEIIDEEVNLEYILTLTKIEEVKEYINTKKHVCNCENSINIFSRGVYIQPFRSNRQSYGGKIQFGIRG